MKINATSVRFAVALTALAAISALNFGALVMSNGPRALASQQDAHIPTTGIYSGAVAANKLNDALDAVLTCNKGPSAPTNALGGVAKAGQCWLDDSSATLLIKKRYSGAAWVVEGVIDVSNGLWSPPVGGGAGTVNAATTTDLCASPQAFQTVNSTATITSFGSNCPTGIKKTLVFASAVTLTYNATSMILPGQLDFVSEAGDVAEAVSLGSGNWRVTNVTKINGNAVTNPSVDVGTVLWSIRADVPAKYLLSYGQALSRSSYPDYLAAVTRVQNGTRSSGSNVITTVGDTSSFGVGMPVEGTGIPAGATISSVTATTITLAATCSGACNASSSGTSSVTVFLTGYGTGGSSSTVGAPECRGYTIAGRDDMGGTSAGRLTSTYFGAGSSTPSAAALNAKGGAESQTLSIAQMPAHDHGGVTGSGGNVASVVNGGTAVYAGSFTAVVAGGGSSVYYAPYSSGSPSPAISVVGGSHTHGVTSQGSGNAHPIVPPTLVLNCLVRVLAMNEPANDDLPASARVPVAFDRRFA